MTVPSEFSDAQRTCADAQAFMRFYLWVIRQMESDNLDFFKQLRAKLASGESRQLRYASSFGLRSFDRFHKFLTILFDQSMAVPFAEYESGTAVDFFLLWGLKPSETHYRMLVEAYELKIPVVFIEDGFIRSLHTWANPNADPRETADLSFILDPLGLYYNAMAESYVSRALAEQVPLSESERIFSRELIARITSEYITKYNHQPVRRLEMDGDSEKVLVVDQSYGDAAIEYAYSSDESFERMLNAALEENPEAFILVKTHPDALADQKRRGYFSNLESSGRMVLLTEEINPVSLLQQVDRVYVVSSQMGFEALLCGKPVISFGVSFYSGYGLTDDRNPCQEQHERRSIEELFHELYVKHSVYVNPDREAVCDINQVIDWIVANRSGSILSGETLCLT